MDKTVKEIYKYMIMYKDNQVTRTCFFLSVIHPVDVFSTKVWDMRPEWYSVEVYAKRLLASLIDEH